MSDDEQDAEEIHRRLEAINRKLDHLDVEAGKYGPLAQTGAILGDLLKWPVIILLVVGILALGLIISR